MTEEVRKIAKAAGVVGFFTLLSRITGLLRDIVVGYLFGAQAAADAFFVAFRIPNLLRRLTAEGALTVAFIPVFTNYLAHKGRSEAVKVARVIFTFVALFLAAITLLGIIFAEPITRLFAPGFMEEHEKFSLTVFLTRLMFPYIFFVSLVALAMGVLNTLRHFMAPALSPVFFNLSIVLCAISLSPFLAEPVSSLAYGVLLGGVVQLLLQLPFLSRYGISAAFDFDFRHPALGRLLFLMGPAVFGAAVYQINVLISTILASMLPSGSVSYLYYADRLLEFPVGVFAIALGTAALPSFSSLVAKRELDGLRGALTYALRIVNFISLPASIGLMVLAVPIFAIFFQRGAFDVQTTRNTADALFFYSLGLWGISGTRLLAPVFYAMEDTKTPVLVALGSFLINLVLSLALMGEVSSGAASGSWVAPTIANLSAHLSLFAMAHNGLALATSVSATFNFLVLLLLLHRRLEGLPLGEFAVSFVRNLLSALLMALPLAWLVGTIDWIGTERNMFSLGAFFILVLSLGLVIYVVLSFLLRSPERTILREVAAGVKKRLKMGTSL